MTEEIIERDISSSDLYLALEDLVMYTLKRQIDNSCRPENIYRWAQEECTVKFAGPRRCGHSTAVVKLCKYIFKNPLVIATSRAQVDELSRKFDTMGVNKPDILRTYMLKNDKGRLYTQYDGVIVDNARFLYLDELDLIYHTVISNKFLVAEHVVSSFCFVLVG